jgi:hypothetical protein
VATRPGDHRRDDGRSDERGQVHARPFLKL